MNLLQAIDECYGDIDLYIQESYWSEDFSSEKAYELLKVCLDEKGLILVEQDDLDYDTVFWEFYRFAEKGLS
jgi:hypothetical protein